MAPFKEEGGGASKMRVLYSVSQELGTGWLVTEVLSRVTFTPHELSQQSRQIRPMEQGHGRWSDRRQTTLPWDSQEKTQDAQEEAQEEKLPSWLEGLGRNGSSGSPPTSITGLASEGPPPSTDCSQQSSRELSQPHQEVSSGSLLQSSSRLSRTTPKISQPQRKRSQTSRVAPTGLGESSAKSSSRRRKGTT